MTAIVVNMCGIEYYVKPSALFMFSFNEMYEVDEIGHEIAYNSWINVLNLPAPIVPN